MDLRKGYKQTEVGLIPEDWKVLTIGESMRLVNGCAFKPSDWTDQGAPIIRIQNLNDSAAKFNYFSGFVEDRHRINAGDLLFAWSGTKGTSFGARIWGGLTGVLNQHIFKVLPDEKRLTIHYAYLVFLRVQGDIEKQAHGFKASFVHVKKSDLVSIKLPLPPTKTEQTAIASALSDADAWIQSITRLIVKKRQIKQGAMQTLLNPYENGRLKAGWVVKKMPEVCWYQEGPGVRNSQFTKSGVKLLNGTNIENGKLLLEKTNRYISEKEAYGWYSHFLADEDDILIACSGITVDKFHEKVTVLKAEHLPLCMNTSTMRFKVTLKCLLHSYLTHFLRSRDFKDQIGGKATGSAQLNFGPSHVNAVDINLPPIKEQTRIATILSDMDSEITALETKLTKAQQIKQGMMQNLLTGKIRLVRPKARVVPLTTKSSVSTKHNEHFNEAVVIAVLADKFGSYEYPLGRKRYTKLSYLLHRYCQESISAYEKKAAGPYNPKTRYSGAEKIATNSQYISAHKNGKFTGFIAAEKIAKAYEYFNIWYGQGALSWLEQFRKTTNDTLELWTTVDMAMVELNKNNTPINLESVKDIIAKNKEWKAKLARPVFSDDHIVNVINKSQTLFSF